MSLISLFTNIITSPTQAFGNLKEKGHAWLPLLLVVTALVLINSYYFSVVDFKWMVEQMVIAQAGDQSPAEQEQLRSMFIGMGAKNMMAFSAVGSLVTIPIMFAIYALYYLITSNIRDDELTFSNCFTLVAWSNIPLLFTLASGFITILLSDNGQIAQSLMKGLNLNDLIFHFPAEHPWYTWMSSLDLTLIWSTVLIAVGYQTWTKASTTASYIIAILPSLLFFGIWAALI